MVALLPPAQLVVPAGTREHSLALFSELWEAGCHRGSQELEVSPGVGEGQRMSAPSLLSTRPCQATGAPTHSTRCEWGSFRVEGWAGREACCEVEYRVTRKGSLRGKAAPLCSGERGCVRGGTRPLRGHRRQGQGSLWVSQRPCHHAGLALHNLRGPFRQSCAAAQGLLPIFFTKCILIFGSRILVTFDHKPGMLVEMTGVNNCG